MIEENSKTTPAYNIDYKYLNNPQSAFSSRIDEIPGERLSEDEAELVSMVHVGKNAARS
jgi:hypothetical protein